MATQTTTPSTEPTGAPDLAKLTKQANELRGAMVDALGKADDAKVRKLGNELAQVNKSILDREVTAQSGERDTFRDSMYDALNEFELDGLMLTVKFNDEDGVASIAFVPTDDTINLIKAAVAAVARPTSATKWVYAWSKGDDGQMHQDFDFGKGAIRTGTNGSRTVGWTTPTGSDTTLGVAFDACATKAEKDKLGTLSGGSATNAHKVLVVTKAGYIKK